MSARVLIAGCGYVGGALARMLVADRYEVLTLTRNGRPDLEGATSVRADLTLPESLARLPEGIQAVVFTAAVDSSTDEAYRAIYVEGLRNLVRSLSASARPPERWIVTTSTGVYGQNGGEEVDENSETKPSGFSGRRLLESEAVAAGAPNTHIVVRLGGIYGPGRTRFIDRVREGLAPLSRAPAYTNRIHRDDCAGVMRHLLQIERPHSVYVGVDDDPAERNDVIRWLAARLGAETPVTDPDSPASATGKRCRNDRLLSTGYRFRYPTFREGYGEMIDEIGLRAADDRTR